MNRSSSTIAVLGLFLIAVVLCMKRTLDFYDALGARLSGMFLTAEVLVAAIIFASAVLLLRRKFSKRSGFTRPTRPEAFAHLRRLFAGVWS